MTAGLARKEWKMGDLSRVLVSNQGPLTQYAEKLLKDVTPDMFARQPKGSSGVISTNHPAFVYGHLALYAKKVMEIVAGDTSGLDAPEGFTDLFEAGKECRDDPTGSIYPEMETITSFFFSAHKTMFARLAELDDAQLAAPHGIERDFAKQFPSRAAFASFLIGPHAFVHIGQLSAWRRCMGLGSAF
ncbi:MAG: DinB family protein [Phycisphaerales bacterium]|nr:DinB family protein [Phycisphaerales bacterium]